ncbi:MAG: hypothetical protein PHR56_01220 [Dehalococcoidales bacterium]|nr:hypothetical protein [Dehalococcoidales bacterium]
MGGDIFTLQWVLTGMVGTLAIIYLARRSKYRIILVVAWLILVLLGMWWFSK